MNGSTTDHQAATSSEQSVGTDPRSKRNSGLFAFFRWFKPGSKESVDEDNASSRSSSSLESVASDKSAGTVASFHYVPPNAYENKSPQEKQVIIGPETDTYKARLKQRDKRREKDKNVTLRKKYNLFFNKETLLKSLTPRVVVEEENNSKSLPLMPKTHHIAETDEQQKIHRRTNSESSKLKKAGAYVHVRGKRRAPQPPGLLTTSGGESSSANGTLKRKKRLAPTPPTKVEITVLCDSDAEEKDVLSNDSLILDHGVLKPVKEENRPKSPLENHPTLATTGVDEAPVSPRPWYKRNSTSKEIIKENKYEPIERLPEVPFKRNSSLDLTLEDAYAEKDKKRKSGMSFLTNISELDREASEIMKNKSEYEKIHVTKASELYEIPEFMKPRVDSNKPSSASNDSWVAAPKRRSARDLIAKFNAITNRTSVFGGSQKEKHFNKQISLDETRQRQEQLLKSHKKCIEDIDRKKEEKFLPLAKSESASAVKLENNKKNDKIIDRRSWKCPKCNLDNEYWRIICHVCSAIKPYFDDFSSSSSSVSSTSAPSSSKVNREKSETKIAGSPLIKKKEMLPQNSLFERSKTQIGFSALATYNQNKSEAVSCEEKSRGKVDNSSKKEERDKLKKMLIEMKNSLPKRKTNMLLKQNSRSSVILENAENNKEEINEVKEEVPSLSSSVTEKTQAEKVAEILIGTREIIYENIKVRKTEIPKPLKVSSSAQTSAVVRKLVPESSLKKLIENHKTNNSAYEPMKVQDFEDIYSDKNGSKTPARIYANLAQNDELSLFFNVPKNVSNLKNNLASGGAGKNNKLFTDNNNADTLEINRLLRRLETAIAKGDMVEAAIFAKELAQLKVNCSVIRQKHHQDHQKKHKGIQIEMYVEDKVSHRGPFPIVVTETQTVAELKQQISRDFEIPVEVQKWILGKELVVNDNNNLKYHKVTQGCPVFLYLVAPEKKTNNNDAKNILGESQSAESSNVQYRKNVTPIDEKLPSTQIVESNKNNKTDGAPKVVNVIPKSSEIIPEAKPEIVRIIPISKAIPTKIEEVPKANKILLSSIQPPSSSVTLTEIKVDIKPYTSRYSNNLKEEKPGLVRATSTKVEVLQCPPAISSPSNSSKTPEQTMVTPKSVDNNRSQNNCANISSASLAVKEKALPSTSSVTHKLIDDIPVEEKPNSLVELSNALKTVEVIQAKDWECHLCTLLNPDSSNICAVCATVRVIQKTTLKKSPKRKPAPQPQRDQTYLQLVNLDSTDLVPNADDFECKVCFLDIPKGEGVTLRECLHEFCKDCLSQSVEFSDEAEVKCPYRDDDYACNIAIQDREIKALVSREVYDQYLAKSVSQAENKMEKTFHCKTPDCKGWCIFEDNVNEFRCPVCRKTNCLTCQAIHMGANCKQYQQRMEDESDMNEDAKRTKDFLDEMVEKGEAIACPTCKVILMKKWGCDWLRCSMCKTEICWVTRGPRWGPAGKGDSSGGCNCGENGIKCHPKCNYCH